MKLVRSRLTSLKHILLRSSIRVQCGCVGGLPHLWWELPGVSPLPCREEEVAWGLIHVADDGGGVKGVGLGAGGWGVGHSQDTPLPLWAQLYRFLAVYICT